MKRLEVHTVMHNSMIYMLYDWVYYQASNVKRRGCKQVFQGMCRSEKEIDMPPFLISFISTITIVVCKINHIERTVDSNQYLLKMSIFISKLCEVLLPEI